MPIFIIDTSIDPTILDYEQTNELDGREFVLRFIWNSRDESWNLSLYLTDGTLLIANGKIILNLPLFLSEVDTRLPPGMIMAIDPTGSDVEPGVDELGARVKLMYYDEAELALESFSAGVNGTSSVNIEFNAPYASEGYVFVDPPTLSPVGPLTRIANPRLDGCTIEFYKLVPPVPPATQPTPVLVSYTGTVSGQITGSRR